MVEGTENGGVGDDDDGVKRNLLTLQQSCRVFNLIKKNYKIENRMSH